MKKEYEITVEVTVSVSAESEDEAYQLAEDWCGLAEGYPQEEIGFVCATARR